MSIEEEFYDSPTIIVCGQCMRLKKQVHELKQDLEQAENFRTKIQTRKGFQMRSKTRREHRLIARAMKDNPPPKVVEKILGRSLKKPKPLTRIRKKRSNDG